MLNFGKKVVKEVVRDNEVSFCGITYMLSDDEIYSLKAFIDEQLVLEAEEEVEEVSQKKSSSKGKAKAEAPTIAEKEDVKKSESTPNYKPTPNYAKAMKRTNNLWSSDLCCVSVENKQYRLRFNYNLIGRMAKGKESTYDYLKNTFKTQAQMFGAKWHENDDDVDFGWYVFPSKGDAEDYVAFRKHEDEKRAKNN